MLRQKSEPVGGGSLQLFWVSAGHFLPVWDKFGGSGSPRAGVSFHLKDVDELVILGS